MTAIPGAEGCVAICIQSTSAWLAVALLDTSPDPRATSELVGTLSSVFAEGIGIVAGEGFLTGAPIGKVYVRRAFVVNIADQPLLTGYGGKAATTAGGALFAFGDTAKTFVFAAPGLFCREPDFTGSAIVGRFNGGNLRAADGDGVVFTVFFDALICDTGEALRRHRAAAGAGSVKEAALGLGGGALGRDGGGVSTGA